ncbi:MAG: prenyltransferase [Gammaproteobacteria bacterium]|nr:prenyltransferase [Gammaproteobacteria bacterium]MBU1409027.1 prenyltransferase [Gammaproteobacteria bacterium]MBU1533552.1 prenyltransferase [Gammaproteobacteria bacterium]
MSPAPSPCEPSRERLANPFVRYLLATRPAFLSITLAGCLLGFATADADGAAFGWGRALATLSLTMLAHAGINVLNDYCDHLNGSDARNTQRIYPYTGGSRFIQNGVLTPRQVLGLAVALFAVTIAGGLWLLSVAGAGLFWIGLAGLAIGWAYSAPPLQLNSRGVGELCVAAGFLLVVAGADYAQRGAFAPLPWLAGAPFALLVAGVLYINQFPDREADRASGKLHWVARLQPAAAAWGYSLILLLAALSLLGGVLSDALPLASLVALAALLPAGVAARQLLRFSATPERLAPAIRLTLFAAHAQPLLLAAILLSSGDFP